jgi:serine/threonine protein kinase
MPNYVCTLDDLPRSPELAGIVATAMKRIERAIRSLHSAGFVHCDIKPANCFVSSNGDVFLGDYGSVVALCDRNLNKMTALATDHYTPSEVKSHVPCTALDFALFAATIADLLAVFVPGKKKFSLYTDHELLLPYDGIFSLAKKVYLRQEGIAPQSSAAATSTSSSSELNDVEDEFDALDMVQKPGGT